MPNWFIVRNSTEQGPLSSEQLRKLVISGQVQPDDLLHREDISKAVRAGAVQGLFNKTPTTGKTPESTKPPAPPNPSGVPPVQVANSFPSSPSTPTSPTPPGPVGTKKSGGSPMKLVAMVCLGVSGLCLLCCFGGFGMIVANRDFVKKAADEAKRNDQQRQQKAASGTDGSGTHSPTQWKSDQPSKDVARQEGDPSVDFAKLDLDSVDLSVGPQGQPVETKEEVTGLVMARTRHYRGSNGQFYKHGEQRVVLAGGIVFSIDNFVYGKKHGYSLLNASNSEPLKNADERWFINGDERRYIMWIDKSRGLKGMETNKLNGELHGWMSLWDENGLLSKDRYEHGKMVEKSKEPFQRR